MSPEKAAEARMRELLTVATAEATSELHRLCALYPARWRAVVLHPATEAEWLGGRRLALAGSLPVLASRAVRALEAA